MSNLSRRQFMASAAAASAAVTFPSTARSRMAADDVNMGFISCGGRAGQHMPMFDDLDGVNIAGLCDPDENRLGKAQTRYPGATGYADLRSLIDDASVDAVVVATCNHWHCLASIWAMEAGKDVYVEKPLSHSQWEGRQTVAAARKYNRICQVGTQQRSDPMQAEIKKFLHEEKALGQIVSARVNRYGVRGPIGRRDSPLEIGSDVDYDLWLGPAQDQPIFRDKLQYDWHWDFNTGSGEMGNWGVHVLDDLRNNVFQDSVGLPKRIFGAGGRVAWDDAGDTPNVHFVYFDTGTIPVVIGLTNMTAGPQERKSPQHPGPGSGYIAYCEGGRFEGQRGRGAAYDKDGKKIREFKGNGGNRVHHQNFIDAIRNRNHTSLNSDVEVGHLSTGWCNLANIAFQSGKPFKKQDAGQVAGDGGIWQNIVSEMEQHLEAHGVELESDDIKLSPMLTVDERKEVFVGDNADVANVFLKREYRAPYIVPEIEA
ncbi:MAG: Gfo/Idh/MocA family oxidoreductase [Fuerstiella sp.]|nr:Gfo/Idh/MocA family oxidoreductase [Fuerstiella sp.]